MDEVIEAFNDIEKATAAATERYRNKLREAIAAKTTTQAEVGRAIKRSREALRQDLLTEGERQELREAELERIRNRRAADKA